MEWAGRLNESIQYIEAHLTEEADYRQLGRIACCSAYHYQRMFAYMAGTTLTEYIRRRRMSLAAVDLQSGEKVVDVAVKYGYRSPTAFNRAFQAIHGVTPSAVQAGGVPVRSFPPITFTISVKGAEKLEYRVEKKEAFRVLGISAPLERELERNFAVVPQLWQRAASDGTVQRLAGLMNAQPVGLLGVSLCNDGEAWRYYIAVASTADRGEFEACTVPASAWAIFPGAGSSQSIQDLERRAVTEWLPTSGYEYGSAPDIEVYLNPDPQDARYEVWIPVVKKQERSAGG